MKITLLVENNPRIESVYVLNLATWLGLEVVTKKRAEFVISYLEENPGQVNLIIVRAVIDKELTAKIILDYLNLKQLSVPVIVVGQGEFPSIPQIPNSLDLKAVIKTAAHVLNVTAKEMAARPVPDYFPIPILYFHVIKRSVVTVFAKDPDDPSKYLKRLEKHRDFESQNIKELIQEGITHLYVDKLDRLEFVNNVSSEIISQLEEKELSKDEQISAMDKNMELLSRKLLTLGLTEETIELAKKNMNSIRNSIKAYPKIGQLIKRMLLNRTSYLFKHTQILTYVAVHIVDNIDWGNEEQKDKISFICFFHDIVLENDAQCQIKTTAELKAANLTQEQRSLVEKHAQIAAELVSKFPHAPMGTDQIIRQHHGQLNGVGFSEHFGANVSPISIVMIVAEEFTRILLRYENGNLDQTEMLTELKTAFPTSRFAKVIEKLNTLSV